VEHARRLPVVGVMGSGRDADESRAEALGRLLAALGVHLLTGGGAGAMEAVSRAYHAVPGRAGLVLGVLPGVGPHIATGAGPRVGDAPPEPPPGYPNPWVEIAIRTHLPLSGERGTDPMSRNHVNVLSADAVVALAGSAGTASEVRLARTYKRPVIAFVAQRGDVPELPDDVPHATALHDVEAFLHKALRTERPI
jgi:predicted Rossmann-fold nucleotide-binding protein